MRAIDLILEEIDSLNEYEQKQLIIVLTSKMLTTKSFKDAINLSKSDGFGEYLRQGGRIWD